MPLKWEILHDQKLVHIVAQGRVTLPEMEEHFDALAVADVLQYGKLFDATEADPIYSDEDVMAMGARLSAYTSTLKSGLPAVRQHLAGQAAGADIHDRARGARLARGSGGPGRRPAQRAVPHAEGLTRFSGAADQEMAPEARQWLNR